MRRKFLSLSNFTSNDIVYALIEIDATFTSIDKQAIYSSIDTNFKDILTRQDYNAILRVFNLKNALISKSQVCEMTGIRNKLEYKNTTITLLKRKDQISEMIKAEIDAKIIKNAT